MDREGRRVTSSHTTRKPERCDCGKRWLHPGPCDRPSHSSRARRRPLLWLIRHYVGGWIIVLGDKIEGDFRYETISGPDFDGSYVARPVPPWFVEEEVSDAS